MTASQPPHSSALQALWLAEALRLREEHGGALQDQEANRQARAQGGELRSRIIARALWLARHSGLLPAQARWLQGARLALGMLLLTALVSGSGLAFAALGDGQRPVNVFWAVGSLLGVNLLMLLAWLASLVGNGRQPSVAGRLWWWLSEKLARDAAAAHLGPALVVLLQRQRLNRWVLGLLSNSLWTAALSAAWVTLWLLLATRRYGFVWETTLLSPATFIDLTLWLGSLPGLLGFQGPDAVLVAASAQAFDAASQAWASWLLGVLAVYGIVPRLALALLCLWRWQRGRQRLDIDLELPGYSELRERLMPSSERIGITDPAPPPSMDPPMPLPHPAGTGAVLTGIELLTPPPWPQPLPASVYDAGVLDSRESRHQLLERLTLHPPTRLVIACDPRRSPDRGTLALLGELSRCADDTRIWLLPASGSAAHDPERLADWHEALARAQLVTVATPSLNWLETGHD